MGTILSILLACLLPLSLGGCHAAQEGDRSAGGPGTSVTQEQTVGEESQGSVSQSEPSQGQEGETMKTDTFYITVGGETFAADFADNVGAQGLAELLAQGPVTIQMRDYGGFEKVGALGQSLPSSNRQTTTQAGDIVLYQGDQIVLFYGSNAWSYTRLGRITDLSGWQEALGPGDVSVTLSLAGSRG